MLPEKLIDENKNIIKRRVTQIIESCYQCPFLEIIDGFAVHYLFCDKIGLRSKACDGVNTQEVDDEVSKWFSQLCKLEIEPRKDTE